jgi:hypothetical protein
MAADKEIREVIKAMEKAINRFQGRVPKIQQGMFDALAEQLKDLSTKDGKVLNSIQNLKMIGNIRNKLERIVISPEYKSAVKEFMGAFETVSGLQQNYFTAFMEKFRPKATLKVLRNLSIDKTVNDLIGQGLQANVIDKVQNILRQNITVAGSYASLTEQMRNHILTSETGEGALERYSRTITTDAINQYSAQYHDAIAQDLKFNWGRYVGSNITTTRELCEYLTKKEWVHRDELPAILEGKVDGHQCKISKSTGLPLGMIPGTTVDNFKVLRGGYNCGHQFFWVPDSVVPDNIKNKKDNKKLKTNFFQEKQGEIKRVFSDVVLNEAMKKSHLTYEQIVSLTGGIPKDHISDISHTLTVSGEIITSSITSKQHSILRTIHTGAKWIYNDYMRVNDAGGGIGLNLFLNQVKEARNAGFKYLKVSAAGDYYSRSDWNGYQTWAKFGYVMSPADQHLFDNTMRSHGRPEKTVFELVSSKEGAEFWERNGEGWSGTFELHDGSQSMQNLQAYLTARNIDAEL